MPTSIKKQSDSLYGHTYILVFDYRDAYTIMTYRSWNDIPKIQVNMTIISFDKRQSNQKLYITASGFEIDRTILTYLLNDWE